MQQRTLGTNGLKVSAIGLGCMGMSGVYGKADEAESIATIHRALDIGVTFIDTADIYGEGHNEELVGRALKGRRGEAVLATKFGNVVGADGYRFISGKPDYVKEACDRSLKRLGVEAIDLYYQHRVDPKTPIEETVGAMAELVKEGKVRYLGLSEAGAETIQRAHAVHPISALQSEWSIWSRDIESEIVPMARTLGIGIVAYSPLGRGFLAGRFKSKDDFEAGDFRTAHPRFSGENLEANLRILRAVEEIAAARKMSAAQVALAWVQGRGSDVIALVGTKRVAYLEENVATLGMALTEEESKALDGLADAVAGTRYPDMSMVGR
jgi:aryl-alcohol dehydrogenase-like predicted oxidoreductase